MNKIYQDNEKDFIVVMKENETAVYNEQTAHDSWLLGPKINHRAHVYENFLKHQKTVKTSLAILRLLYE